MSVFMLLAMKVLLGWGHKDDSRTKEYHLSTMRLNYLHPAIEDTGLWQKIC